jgi:CheY-like chemotaxis protein
VLLVEDDLASRISLSRLLEVSGLEVVEAGDAKTAIERLSQQSQTPFDAIISDMYLPDLDGGTLLRSAASLVPKPVLALMTGATAAETADALRGVAVDHVFLKPASIRDVLERLRQLFAKNEAEGVS